jgi:hypothetical protein
MARKELNMIIKTALQGWRGLSKIFTIRERLYLVMTRSTKTCTRETREQNQTKERSKTNKNMTFGAMLRKWKTRNFSEKRSLMTLMSSLISRGSKKKKELLEMIPKVSITRLK